MRHCRAWMSFIRHFNQQGVCEPSAYQDAVRTYYGAINAFRYSIEAVQSWTRQFEHC